MFALANRLETHLANLGLAGAGDDIAVLVLGTIYLATSVWFACRRDDRTARCLLIASLVYLPAMLAVFLGSATAFSGVW